jgi:hypothetical protein
MNLLKKSSTVQKVNFKNEKTNQHQKLISGTILVKSKSFRNQIKILTKSKTLRKLKKSENIWKFSYIIYQGTDILPEIFLSSPDRRVFVARKLHEGFSPRVILSDKHECWTARKKFWRYISVPRYIRKRIARKNFSLGQLYRKFSLGKISA